MIFFGCVFFLLAGLSSCTLEKRHYRNGYYVDWSRNSTTHVESSTQDSPEVSNDLSNRIIPVTDSSCSVPEAKPTDAISSDEGDKIHLVASGKHEEETLRDVTYNPEKTQSPLPIEKDKKQATGAGVAAAIFFILAMVGLVIKGTAPPTGIFIVAAFVCCVLCIVLASFLYPRDPVVKQPKDETVIKNKGIAAAGIGLLIVGFLIFVLFFGLLLSIFTDLLY
jgi:hypothetical protein